MGIEEAREIPATPDDDILVRFSRRRDIRNLLNNAIPLGTLVEFRPSAPVLVGTAAVKYFYKVRSSLTGLPKN